MWLFELLRKYYWSDYQTNEQYFGLLSFDPGTNQSICYVDGDISEWDVNDIVAQNEDGSSLSMKYDERFVYLMVRKNGFSIDSEKLYIPIDTTQKSGSNYATGENVKFNRAADFLLVLDGKENSRLLVQERYEALRAHYSGDVYGFNTYYEENIPENPYKEDPCVVKCLSFSPNGDILGRNAYKNDIHSFCSIRRRKRQIRQTHRLGFRALHYQRVL